MSFLMRIRKQARHYELSKHALQLVIELLLIISGVSQYKQCAGPSTGAKAKSHILIGLLS